MYIQNFLIVGIIVIGVCMLLIILILLYLYLRVNRALNSVSTEFTQYKTQSEDAAQRALTVAQQKALEIITETKIFTNEVKLSLENAINKSITSGTSTYNELMNEIKNKTAGQMIAVEKSLESQTRAELLEIANTGKTEAQKISDNLQKISEDSEKKLLAELSVQKEKELTNLKNKVVAMLPEVVTEVVTGVLSKEDQEKIAIDAISRVKTKHGL